MGKVSAILNYDAESKAFTEDNIFGLPMGWRIPSLVALFYGTVAIMPMGMEKRGAIPGILAICPTCIPVDSAWCIRSLCRKLGDCDTDIQVTSFLTGSSYREFLDRTPVSRLFVVMNSVSDRWDDVHSLVGEDKWIVDSQLEIGPKFRILTLSAKTHQGMGDMSTDDISEAIDDIAMEMGEADIDDLNDPESRNTMANLFDIIMKTWSLFERYDKIMLSFLASTLPDKANGTFGGTNAMPSDMAETDDYDGCLEETDTNLQEPTGIIPFDSVHLDADGCASAVTVQMLADTMKQYADKHLDVVKKVNDHTVDIRKLSDQVASLDAAMCEALRGIETTSDGRMNMLREQLDGLIEQIDAIVRADRRRNILSIICILFTLIAIACSSW